MNSIILILPVFSLSTFQLGCSIALIQSSWFFMDHTVNKYFSSLFIAKHSYEIETLFSFYRLYKEKVKTEGQFRWKNRDI